MERQRATLVTGKDGLRGVVVSEAVEATADDKVRIQLDDGIQLLVARTMLVPNDEGYYLPFSRGELVAQSSIDNASGARIVVPIIAETLDVQKRKEPTGVVRIKKIVREREELVDEPLLREQVHVEHVSIDRVVERIPEVRREGDVVIIPVVEEVLVVEKRLLLKEELHITMQQTTFHQPQRVLLRSEEAVVERNNPPDRTPDTRIERG